mgnify:CR=1 FL=1
MKKNIFFILIALIIPIKVNAATVSINCNKTKLNINEETTCKLNISNLDFTITDIVGSVNVGNNLTITSSTYDSKNWLSLDNKFNVEDINLMRQDKTHVSNITIATFKVKASKDANGTSSVAFNNVAVGNSNYESISLNCNPVSINFGNNVNTLSNLSINEANINFSSDKTNYETVIDKDNIEIKATATDSKAKITGIGKQKLNYGENTIKIVVTAENGSSKTYTLKITRPDNRSSINDLSNIKLNVGLLNFDKNKTNYTINVENEIENIEIEYDVADSKSKAELIGNKQLSVGENKFIIKVTAENGKVKEYTIIITREKKVEITNSNKASNIMVTGYNINFNKDKNEYFINTTATELNIEVVLEDTNAKYEIIGNENLTKGSIVSIIITDKDNNNNIYKINIEDPTLNNKETDSSVISIVLLVITILINIVTIIIINKRKTIINNN